MARTKRARFRPIDRFDEALRLADWWMAARGYVPCKDCYQPKWREGIVSRLYTQHASRGVNNGGVSVAFMKEHLLKPGWGEYIQAQITLALSRSS